jgi:peptidoglycan-associated lipoprotein
MKCLPHTLLPIILLSFINIVWAQDKSGLCIGDCMVVEMIEPTPTPLKDIFFDFDEYDLTVEAREILNENAEWLKNNPYYKIEIQGHSDSRGTNIYNIKLGELRAEAVKEYLLSLGVKKTRINVISYGEEKPFCSEENEICFRQNERVHFLIIGEMK